MYNSLGRRGGLIQPAGARVRQVPADLHEGTAADFLRRHECESATAARGSKKNKAAFAALLLRRVADPRNLKLALDHIAREGGEAPGPNGLRPRELGSSERWDLARALGHAIRAGSYQPGSDRLVRIPKEGGQGDRTLRIQNVEDRVVQRGIVQILQPLLDPWFLETNFGSRPRFGRENALAKAEALARSFDLWVWAVEDIQNAFDQVPIHRLLDVLRKHVPADDLVSLVEVVVRNDKGRGLRQGGALSPLLLNVYLDHFLDRPWKKTHPQTPLIRFVDDLLILCPDMAQARQAREALQAALQPAALPLKEGKSLLRDLGAGEGIEWLGFNLRRTVDGLEARLTERWWSRLDESLAVLHEQPNAPIRALETIDGWISQSGPCYDRTNVREICARIERTALRYAFEEVPSRHKVQDLWTRAYDRWVRLREDVVRRETVMSAGGSARPSKIEVRYAASGASTTAPRRRSLGV